MKTNFKQLFTMFFFTLMVSFAGNAQKKVEVNLVPGAANKVIKGTIKGDAYTDYAIYLEEGQMFKATYKGSTKSSSMNIMPPNSQGEAFHVGDRDGNTYSGKIDKSGVYTVRVSQMRSAARRGTPVTFSLTLNLKN